MRKTLILAAAIASTVLSGGIAIAATTPKSAATPQPMATQAPYAQSSAMPQRGPARRLMRADANADGVITKQEAIAEATRQFDRYDLNRDGKLDANELAQVGQGRGGRGGRGMRGMGGGDDVQAPSRAY